MTGAIWNQIIESLTEAVKQSDHPWRTGSLATQGLDNMPRQRTIVLREFDPDSVRLCFYTDSRSKKMVHIKEDKRVSLLLYNPKELVQLRLEGIAIKESDEKQNARRWAAIPESSRKDYITHIAPGSEIPGPDSVEYLHDEKFFASIYIQPHKIEYLQLKRPNHLRVRYSREGDVWNGEFLVP
ncbi:Pyridoxine/pyridoxamine 5'-phosphate oxidase [Robiginitalea myxolifaciens]|uniref:Pyridoxine/pyridoxamine 5'-phosphate oxidase n=1 Tax=Robiginitalea myxolifaciens TaxID=400055 RepID=A0A1I6H4W8_9FLAO|nr:pyridoxamine 5'-phosphate oxidase family protein [Robiginitalea myxolifaciens]SFR49546.1 Pyridoxine/pyridoxamine 5'-phosphate oxidase [Robiginitalea myxolifaciens]